MKRPFISAIVVVATLCIAQTCEINAMEQEMRDIATRDSIENANYVLDVVMESDWWEINEHRRDTMSDAEIIADYEKWEVEYYKQFEQ